ncbi:hypothetical protein ACAW63_06235 [Pseudomonas sp. QE6]|uniref:hypothetical protein n=1 Tax=Pseudomonas sp. QE6 TaxID=3242491 RepID=UPI003526EC19
MKQKREVEPHQAVSSNQSLARTVTGPECMSASVLTTCHNLDHSQTSEIIDELRQQTAAIHADDLSRAESMLVAQAHTLDGLFARLAVKALGAGHLETMDRYMRLALKAQNQARATLQTLGELKTPKQIAFVKQANIGNQVQVNNDSSPARTRTRKKQNTQNELLEVGHGEQLDTRAEGTASGADPAMAAVAKKQRAGKR